MTDAGLSCPQAHNNPIPSARRTVLKISLANPAPQARSRPNLRHAEGSALPMRVRLEKTQQSRKDVRHAEHQTVMRSSTTFARLQLRGCRPSARRSAATVLVQHSPATRSRQARAFVSTTAETLRHAEGQHVLSSRGSARRTKPSARRRLVGTRSCFVSRRAPSPGRSARRTSSTLRASASRAWRGRWACSHSSRPELEKTLNVRHAEHSTNAGADPSRDPHTANVDCKCFQRRGAMARSTRS